MKIRSIIVDDEPLSRDILKKYIAGTPDLELISVCSDAFEANDLIRNEVVQLVFLDINMPGLSGIKLIRALTDPPMVIFTTAYPEYALEGFEVDAVDFLVKPFSYERFLKAVNKAAEKITVKTGKRPGIDDFLVLKSDKKIFKVDYKDILYMESYGDYLKVFTAGKCIVVHEKFRIMEEKLPADKFIRVHKSYIIAVDRIKYIEGNQVNMSGVVIPVGLNYRENLLRVFKRSL